MHRRTAPGERELDSEDAGTQPRGAWAAQAERSGSHRDHDHLGCAAASRPPQARTGQPVFSRSGMLAPASSVPPVSAGLESCCPSRSSKHPGLCAGISKPQLFFLWPLSAPSGTCGWNSEFRVMFCHAGQIPKPLYVALSVGELAVRIK